MGDVCGVGNSLDIAHLLIFQLNVKLRVRVPVVDVIRQQLLLGLNLLEGRLDMVAVMRPDDLYVVHADGVLGPCEAMVRVTVLSQSGWDEED